MLHYQSETLIALKKSVTLARRSRFSISLAFPASIRHGLSTRPLCFKSSRAFSSVSVGKKANQTELPLTTKKKGSETILYENHRPNHFKLLSLFAVGQSSYWGFMAVDNWLLTPVVPENADSLVVSFYTHPFWSFFGLGFSACLWGMIHAYSSHYISRISSYGQGMKLQCHTLLGNPSSPLILGDRSQFNFGTAPPKANDGYILLNVHKHQLNYLIDRNNGCFFPEKVKHVSPEGTSESNEEGCKKEAQDQLRKQESELVRRFGQNWSIDQTSGNSSKREADLNTELEPLIRSKKKAKRRKR